MKRIKKFVVLIQRTWQAFGEDNASQMAPAITYYVLFALVPLSMFLFSIANAVALSDENIDDTIERVEDYLNVTPQDIRIDLREDAIPDVEAQYGPEAVVEIEAELEAINESDDRAQEEAALAEAIETGTQVTVAGYELGAEDVEVLADSIIGETLRGVASASTTLGVVELVTLAFSASIGYMAVRRSLNVVWGVTPRPFAQQRVMELSMLVGCVVLLGSSLFVTAAAQVLRDASDGDQNPLAFAEGTLWFAFGYLLPWALTFCLVLLAYRFVPNAPNTFRDVWLGAAIATTAIELLKYGYAIYLANFEKFDAVYGALAGVLILMFFVYMAAYIFLLGAELASEYPKLVGGDHSTDEADAVEGRSLWDTVIASIRGLFLAE